MSTIHAVTNTQSVLDTVPKANVPTDLIGVDAAVIIEGQFNHTRTLMTNIMGGRGYLFSLAFMLP
jgi:hypothetical protein